MDGDCIRIFLRADPEGDGFTRAGCSGVQDLADLAEPLAYICLTTTVDWRSAYYVCMRESLENLVQSRRM